MAKRRQGHYCKICGGYKSNESFSGKGHAAHICKKCAALSPGQRAESSTLTKLWNLPWRLSQQQKDWLKGLLNDENPEIADAAKEIYASRFPHALRNERKQQLHIKHMDLTIDSEVMDEYGDCNNRQLLFVLDRNIGTVQMSENSEPQQIELSTKEMRKLLNRIVNQYEIYWWDEDYKRPIPSIDLALLDDDWALDVDLEEEVDPEPFTHEDPPTWKVSVCYANGEAQEMCGYDEYLPDHIQELVIDLLSLFEDEEMEDSEEMLWFDD